jgi:hypothetical protein
MPGRTGHGGSQAHGSWPSETAASLRPKRLTGMALLGGVFAQTHEAEGIRELA